MARLNIRRGDFVLTALPGDYGKPRPALVVQSNEFPTLHSVTLCMLTTHILGHPEVLRMTVEPSLMNGLTQTSQIVIDKINTQSIAKIRSIIGRADDALMMRVNQALAVFLGIV